MTTQTNIDKPSAFPPALLAIAKEWLWVETFEQGLPDGDEYRAVYVPRVGYAMKAAFREGFAAANPAGVAQVPEATPLRLEISKIWLRIDTFDDRLAAQDRYDYRAVHVTRVGIALHAAYQQGLMAGAAARTLRR